MTLRQILVLALLISFGQASFAQVTDELLEGLFKFTWPADSEECEPAGHLNDIYQKKREEGTAIARSLGPKDIVKVEFDASQYYKHPYPRTMTLKGWASPDNPDIHRTALVLMKYYGLVRTVKGPVTREEPGYASSRGAILNKMLAIPGHSDEKHREIIINTTANSCVLLYFEAQRRYYRAIQRRR